MSTEDAKEEMAAPEEAAVAEYKEPEASPEAPAAPEDPAAPEAEAAPATTEGEVAPDAPEAPAAPDALEAENPTPMDQAHDDAILSAVNEAAKEVADAAAMDEKMVDEAPAEETKEYGNAVEEEEKPDDKADTKEVIEKSVEVTEEEVKEEVSTPKEKPKPKKETKKRIRRVGKTTPRKVPKIDDAATPTGIEGAESTSGEAAAAIAAAAANLSEAIPRVLSKHDEKWNGMFEKLVAFKNENNTTLVPQCYDQDPRLGRWVHYQRVEYWIYQQTGNAKITPERVARLEAMGFEWDPQRAQWNQMFEKLKQFKEEVGHCKVPKGYTKDPELANWVRNQRLEHANMIKGKRSRMTEDRFKKLDDLGFKWSTTMTAKGSTPAKVKPAADEETPKEEGENKPDEPTTTTPKIEEPVKEEVKREEEAPKEEAPTEGAVEPKLEESSPPTIDTSAVEVSVEV